MVSYNAASEHEATPLRQIPDDEAVSRCSTLPIYALPSFDTTCAPKRLSPDHQSSGITLWQCKMRYFGG